MNRKILSCIAALCVAALAGCNDAPVPQARQQATAAAEFERGPHNGRLLRDGAFALEITIFEEGVPPEFHVYPYRNDEAIDPRGVRLTISLGRLGGKTDVIGFHPQQDYLRGNGVVLEPHSFDVTVTAEENGRPHRWTYASYEGRTTIPDQVAQSAGVKVETAGAAVMEQTIDLSGRVEVRPQARTEVRAWYPGRIMAMTKQLGEPVRRGEVVARVESSHSLQTYSIPAPLSGVVVERNANVGDVSEGRTLYVIADMTQLHAELYVQPRDAEQVRTGQKVEIRNLTGERRVLSTIETLLPTADPNTQTLTARVQLPPDGSWRPGMAVEGTVTVGAFQAPLAVRTQALQRFRDFTVVYAKYGDTYEVRMLELGRRTPEWTEVLGGLDAGTPYVADNAFLIRADVEKSGAAHDH